MSEGNIQGGWADRVTCSGCGKKVRPNGTCYWCGTWSAVCPICARSQTGDQCSHGVHADCDEMPGSVYLTQPLPDRDQLIERFGDLTGAVVAVYGADLASYLNKQVFLEVLLKDREGVHLVPVRSRGEVDHLAVFAEDADGVRRYIRECVERIRAGVEQLEAECLAREHAAAQGAAYLAYADRAVKVRNGSCFLRDSLQVRDLRERGWTLQMTTQILGHEDTREPVNHFRNYQGARAYAQGRVEAAESTSSFRDRFLASLRRRKCTDEFRDEVLRRSLALERSGAAVAYLWRMRRLHGPDARKVTKVPAVRKHREPSYSPVLVCVLEADGWDDWGITITIRLHTFDDTQALASDQFRWLAVERPASGSVEDAVIDLFPHIIGQVVRAIGDVTLVSGPMVTKERLDEAIAQAHEEQKAALEANALYKDADIVVAAEELGLSPKPGDRAPGYWDANCPRTNHTLILNAKLNEFYCGYGKRKGDIDALRVFKAERERPRKP